MLHYLQRYRVKREGGPLARIDARLLHPIVASERDFPTVLVTLPAGATIEYELSTGTFGAIIPSEMVETRWGGRVYVAHLQDLLNALSVEDAAQHVAEHLFDEPDK